VRDFPRPILLAHSRGLKGLGPATEWSEGELCRIAALSRRLIPLAVLAIVGIALATCAPRPATGPATPSSVVVSGTPTPTLAFTAIPSLTSTVRPTVAPSLTSAERPTVTLTPTSTERPTVTLTPTSTERPTPAPSATQTPAPGSIRKEGSRYYYLKRNSEWQEAPDVPGTHMEARDSIGVVYVADVGNPYGLTARSVAGVFYPEVYIVKDSVETAQQTGAIGVRPEVVRYRLRRAGSPGSTILFPLPFDLTTAYGDDRRLLVQEVLNTAVNVSDIMLRIPWGHNRESSGKR